MCARIIWAVNAAGYTTEFEAFTRERLGVSPLPTAHRIVSDLVRPTARQFVLGEDACECRSLIGLGESDQPERGKPSAEALLSWLRELPEHAPHLSTLIALRAWSPEDAALTPVAEHSVTVTAVTEALLRGVADNELLAVGYAR
ncbi:hypothetical protein D9V32_02175 [Mycetocola tolaasinivorans]|uniref:Uncharacterized protein n=1 Tax=Mycetocola tolaasinivorans TaxID=76635 RepID=A0A3L7AD32_9MICO|nr:hypothetical protein [Mycetocola tolaasinivorans]RLP77282.1 hypothetical protein D9V32_02175 [Mycetocola tolaasinivorans]